MGEPLDALLAIESQALDDVAAQCREAAARRDVALRTLEEALAALATHDATVTAQREVARALGARSIEDHRREDAYRRAMREVRAECATHVEECARARDAAEVEVAQYQQAVGEARARVRVIEGRLQAMRDALRARQEAKAEAEAEERRPRG